MIMMKKKKKKKKKREQKNPTNVSIQAPIFCRGVTKESTWTVNISTVRTFFLFSLWGPSWPPPSSSSFLFFLFKKCFNRLFTFLPKRFCDCPELVPSSIEEYTSIWVGMIDLQWIIGWDYPLNASTTLLTWRWYLCSWWTIYCYEYRRIFEAPYNQYSRVLTGERTPYSCSHILWSEIGLLQIFQSENISTPSNIVIWIWVKLSFLVIHIVYHYDISLLMLKLNISK